MSKSNDTPRWLKAEARRLQEADPELAYAEALRRARANAEVRDRVDALVLPGAPVGVTRKSRAAASEVLSLVRLPASETVRSCVEDTARAALHEHDPMLRWQAMRRMVSLGVTSGLPRGEGHALAYAEDRVESVAGGDFGGEPSGVRS